jgi:hypothetical protein
MDQRLERLEDKMDKMIDAQSYIRADLQEHMRRTEIAETNIEQIAQAIRPIQSHVAFVSGLGKLLSILGTLAGGLATVWQLILRK